MQLEQLVRISNNSIIHVLRYYLVVLLLTIIQKDLATLFDAV